MDLKYEKKQSEHKERAFTEPTKEMCQESEKVDEGAKGITNKRHICFISSIYRFILSSILFDR